MTLHYNDCKTKITPDYVKSRLYYDKDTGIFRWKPKTALTENAYTWNKRYANQVAGSSQPSGEWYIFLDGIACPGHILAWIIATGRRPPNELAHINGDVGDNRLANLMIIPKPVAEPTIPAPEPARKPKPRKPLREPKAKTVNPRPENYRLESVEDRVSYLRERFHYDPGTGDLTSKPRTQFGLYLPSER